jgi:DNA-binding NarL/FixJ family response regulator
LRGEFAEADEAYRQASHWGWAPQPGLALLRLSQGQVDAASALIRRASAETQESGQRSLLLDAAAEIALAAKDVATARAAADELAGIARRIGAPFLSALSDRATGAVQLAEGHLPAALVSLRRALKAWRSLPAPYEAARVRVLIALACRAEGDHETAALELDAARSAFQQLGAAPDLARVEELARHDGNRAAGPLTDREMEVLRLVAGGLTNRAIAGQLRISEKTVARHVSNIFVKLDLSSRAAATAYAFKHQLV